jgi:hypothetical protein
MLGQYDIKLGGSDIVIGYPRFVEQGISQSSPWGKLKNQMALCEIEIKTFVEAL